MERSFTLQSKSKKQQSGGWHSQSSEQKKFFFLFHPATDHSRHLSVWRWKGKIVFNKRISLNRTKRVTHFIDGVFALVFHV